MVMIPNRPNSKLQHDKLPLAGRGYNRTYPANSLQPELVLDAGENYFRKDGSRDSFSNTFTHSRASGATYLDSTGTLQTAASGEIRDQAYTYVDGVLTGPYLQHESAAATNLWEFSTPVLTNFPVRGGNISDTTCSFTPLTAAGIAFSPGGVTSFTYRQYTLTGTHTLSIIVEMDDGLAPTFGSATVDSALNDFVLVIELTPVPPNTYQVEYLGGSTYRVSAIKTCIGISSANYGILKYNANSSRTFKVTGFQLETGSIPTSYIPTSGSTATRAAETLTISNPPWPATITGTELVTNGTFDTDTTGWTAASDGRNSVTWSSGKLRITNITASQGYAYQTISTVVGRVYKIEWTPSQVTTAYATRVYWGNAEGTTSGGGASTAAVVLGPQSITFVATATTTYVAVQLFTTTAGAEYDFDNISVKEITPRGLAIAMDGLVTYADTGVFATVRPYQWVLNGSNLIDAVINTVTTATGQVYFRQTGVGVQDTVISALESYSPGINVPFSIAGRHGDNFINGAVDGTALTANLTPTILPDLSATPIQIGSTFNGYINTLRIWDVDIGDTGIAEASS